MSDGTIHTHSKHIKVINVIIFAGSELHATFINKTYNFVEEVHFGLVLIKTLYAYVDGALIFSSILPDVKLQDVVGSQI